MQFLAELVNGLFNANLNIVAIYSETKNGKINKQWVADVNELHQ